MRTIEDIQNELDEKIPRDVVSTRDGGGKKFSYLETHYVIDRMNKVFGNLGWDFETVTNYRVDDEKEGSLPTYVAKVRIKALIKVSEGQYLSVVKEGTGYGRDKSKLNPHEMAAKEAESDALKRAAMKFGQSMGLALYSKEQENVSDETSTSPVPTGTKMGTGSDRVGGVPAEPAAAVAQTSNREKTNKIIASTSKVILDKKLKTQEELVTLVKSYGVMKKEELTDLQANELLTKLREILK